MLPTQSNSSLYLICWAWSAAQEWDEELAEIAARWAMQCPYYEDDVRDVERFKVANLVGIVSHESSYANLLDVWNEFVLGNVSFYKITDGPLGKVRMLESVFKPDKPLTLITNPYFKYVGCAAAIYRQFIVEDETFRTILVCNYGPLVVPYQKYQPSGLPCTQCPDHTRCYKNSPYPNLCFENMSSSSSRGVQNRNRKVIQRGNVYEDDEDAQDDYGSTYTDDATGKTTWEPHEKNSYSNTTDQGETRVADNRTNSYCEIICDNGAVHTLCAYEDKKNEDYQNVVSLLGSPSKVHMVTTHNSMRDAIASNQPVGLFAPLLPLAANMREIIWNDELEKAAVLWTMQCSDQKDECRDIYLEDSPVPMYVSQLVHVAEWNGAGDAFPGITDAFFDWISGITYFSEDNIVPYQEPTDPTKDYSGFAQIIWADTYMIGCGMTLCRKTNETAALIVTACNYAPGGMVVGKSVFKIGGTCSHCKKLKWKGTRGGYCSMEYKNLCSGAVADVSKLIVVWISFSLTQLSNKNRVKS